MFGTLFHTVLLAQIFGLYLVITATIFLSRVRFFRDLVSSMSAQSGVVFVSSIFGLMLGLFLVDIHNIWVWNPRVAVTILCWSMLLRSVMWLSMPEKAVAITKKVVAGPGYYVAVLFMAIVGIYLLTIGFYKYL